MVKRKILGLFLVVFMLFSFVGLSFAENGVDWDSEIITVTGMGLPIANAASLAYAKVTARRAAITDAYRNMGEVIKGVQINSETSVKNLMLEDDRISAKMDAFINNARIVKEGMGKDGIYYVTLQVNLYGNNSLSKIVYQSETMTTKALPAPSADYTFSNAEKYTGLVIDVTGLDLERCMSPKIVDESGREIYGTMYIDADYLSEHGILGYAYNNETLQKVNNGSSRAGNNPLVVKAVGVENHNYNVVVSVEDGDFILSANQRDQFLQSCSVMVKKEG